MAPAHVLPASPSQRPSPSQSSPAPSSGAAGARRPIPSVPDAAGTGGIPQLCGGGRTPVVVTFQPGVPRAKPGSNRGGGDRGIGGYERSSVGTRRAERPRPGRAGFVWAAERREQRGCPKEAAPAMQLMRGTAHAAAPDCPGQPGKLVARRSAEENPPGTTAWHPGVALSGSHRPCPRPGAAGWGKLCHRAVPAAGTEEERGGRDSSEKKKKK